RARYRRLRLLQQRRARLCCARRGDLHQADGSRMVRVGVGYGEPVLTDPEDLPPALQWSDDAAPGFRRRRAGKGFVYVGPEGARANAATVERIRALAIPPAWRDVWICAEPSGHLQATGRDARGRKQYRY